MKKRSLTLAGGIIGTVLSSILLAVIIVYLGLGGWFWLTDLILCIFFFVMCVVALILNILSLKTNSAPHEVYVKKRGLIITAVVFDFICISWLSSIFYIIDLCKESSKFSGNTQQPQIYQSHPQTPQTQKSPMPYMSKSNITDKLSSLEKLNTLRSNKIITDEEFSQMKQEILNS